MLYVVDMYEEPELLAKCDNRTKARQVMREREADTDGECCVFIYDEIRADDNRHLKGLGLI